jgi:hypothetical protein
MANINESVKKGHMMTMTLKCETEFPKALKNIMLSMGSYKRTWRETQVETL